MKLGQQCLEEHHEFLEEDITDSEWVMQNATGRKSKLRFQETYGEDPTLSLGECRAVVKKLPHMNDLGGSTEPEYSDRDSD